MFADAKSDADTAAAVKGLTSSADSSAAPGGTLVGGIQALGTGAVALTQGFVGGNRAIKAAQRDLDAAMDPAAQARSIADLQDQAAQLQELTRRNQKNRDNQTQTLALACGAALILFAGFKLLQQG